MRWMRSTMLAVTALAFATVALSVEAGPNDDLNGSGLVPSSYYPWAVFYRYGDTGLHWKNGAVLSRTGVNRFEGSGYIITLTFDTPTSGHWTDTGVNPDSSTFSNFVAETGVASAPGEFPWQVSRSNLQMTWQGGSILTYNPNTGVFSGPGHSVVLTETGNKTFTWHDSVTSKDGTYTVN